MNIIELRIGNLVRDIHASDNFYAKVSAISSSRIYYGGFHANPADLKPIPLTEEWILKFGFELNYTGTVSKRFDLTNDPRFDYSFNINGGENCGLRFKGDYIKIQYVHQLQNLYFALTGEELKIID